MFTKECPQWHKKQQDVEGRVVDNKEFIDAVFHTILPGAHVWGTAFEMPPEKATNGDWFGGVVTDRALTRKSLYTSGVANTFYAVSTFRENADGQAFRRKANFASAHVITMDDIGSGASAKIPWGKVVLPPSFVIETSPDNCQVGYILDTPVEDAGYFDRTIDALIAQGLAAPNDPGMKGVTRYVRMPVGWNNKAKYGAPWHHVLREWHPERRYGLQDVISAYRLVLAPPQQVRKQVVMEAQDDVFLKVLARHHLLLTGEVRDAGDIKVVDVLCPWHADHPERGDEGAAYIIGGGYKCWHGTCEGRRFKDVLRWLAEVKGEDINALKEEQKQILRRTSHAAALKLFERIKKCKSL